MLGRRTTAISKKDAFSAQNRNGPDKSIVGNVCITESDSKVANAPCVFPFKHKGVVYEGCPVDRKDKTRRWCSTKIDKDGKHVNGNYGFCSKNCPIELVKGFLFVLFLTDVTVLSRRAPRGS